MKNKNNLLLLFLSISCLSCSESTNNDYEFIKELTSDGFTSGLLKNGNKEGVWYSISNDGDTLKEEIYSRNRLRYQIERISEKKRVLSFFHNGIINGSKIDFLPSGRIENIDFYSDGLITDFSTYFDDKGRVLTCQSFENKTTKEYREYYMNGALKFKSPDYEEGNGLVHAFDSLGTYSFSIKMKEYSPYDTTILSAQNVHL
jgi:antitoxin component YwqK of YwqJK toxin-antitoxin module